MTTTDATRTNAARAATVIHDDERPIGISLRAWGLYCYLQAQDPSVVGAIDGPMSAAFKEGRDAIRNARDELVTHGLVTRESYVEGNLNRTRWTLTNDLRPQ